MKKFLLVLILFFIGCAQTSSNITLPTYESSANQIISNYNVYIQSVKDLRQNQNEVGIIYANNGLIDNRVSLSNNLDYYFMQSISKELRTMGANVTNKPLENSIFVNIEITKLEANIKGFVGSNLNAVGEIKIIIKKGEKTYVKRVSETQSKFALRDKESIKTAIISVLDTLIHKGALQIINLN